MIYVLYLLFHLNCFPFQVLSTNRYENAMFIIEITDFILPDYLINI